MAADSASASESRPPVWAGHVGPHPVTELERSIDFFVALGGRLAVHQPPIASIELRGGTHIVLQLADEVDEESASFDLMVEDIEATHAALVEAGLRPSEIGPSGAHLRFFVTDPDGTPVRFNSSHVVGIV